MKQDVRELILVALLGLGLYVVGAIAMARWGMGGREQRRACVVEARVYHASPGAGASPWWEFKTPCGSMAYRCGDEPARSYVGDTLWLTWWSE
jgi:hypothetical protein